MADYSDHALYRGAGPVRPLGVTPTTGCSLPATRSTLRPMTSADDEPDPSTGETGDPGRLRSICVYCASSTGTNPELAEGAVALAELLAAEGIDVIYGGGSVGLMGLIADTVMAGGGEVTGIIPFPLMPREVGHQGLTRMIEVDSMHARKARMIELSDGFIALPGGFGTLEELAEVLTWAQLDIHAKPVGLLNIGGFYDGLLDFFDRCIADGVLKEKNRRLLIDRTEPSELLAAMRAHRPDHEPKWIDLDRRL